MAAFDEYSDRLGARVRRLRRRAGLSLREFGMMVGVHHNQILSIEQGRANPSLHTLLRIADGFGISLRDLLPDDRAREDGPSYWFSRSEAPKGRPAREDRPEDENRPS